MELYEVLKRLNIFYDEVCHEAVFTTEEAEFIKSRIEGIGCKNLFLTNHKGSYYLVVLKDDKRANMKELSSFLGVSRLSFASEKELESILKLKKGSVTPLGIINDKNNLVTLILDRDLKENKILVHPNTNTKTISINFNDLIHFIEYENHKYLLL